MRKEKISAFFTSLVSMLFLLPNGNVAMAASEGKKRDAYYAEKFEKFSVAFDKHIQRLDKCIAEMETFDKENSELLFSGVACSRLDEMRVAAQGLYNDARAVLEDYIRWIDSLTENTFEELIDRSSSSQSALLAAMRTYLSKQKKALDQSERVMERQMRRLREMEQKIEQAEKQIESSRGGKDSQKPNRAD